MRPNCSSWVQPGIDLKITPDDEVYCFEVNPSPAFSYYESNTGQPISAAIARALTKANVASHQPRAGSMVQRNAGFSDTMHPNVLLR